MATNPTVRQILEDTRRMMAEKQASITGQDPSTIPGAEHDGKVPESDKQPDKEVVDGTEAPGSSYRIDGADDKGDAGSQHTVDAGESVLEPEKKPLITSDANAKVAGADDSPAALANEILGLVHSFQKRASAPKTTTPAAAPGTAAPSTAAPAQKSADNAAGLDLELTTEVMAKIAALVLSTEEGAEMVEHVLSKTAGAEAMHDTMNFLAHQSAEAEKVAAAHTMGARERIAGLLEKRAADNEAMWLYKLGQDAADASVDAIAAEGAEPDPGVTDGMGGGEDPTAEEVVADVEELVASGTVTEEQGLEILEAILGDDGGGVEGELPPEMMGGEVMGAGEPGLEEKIAYYVAAGERPVDILAHLVKTAEADPEEAAEALAALDEVGAAGDEDEIDATALEDVELTPEDVAEVLADLVEEGGPDGISAEDAQEIMEEVLSGEGGADDEINEEELVEALESLSPEEANLVIEALSEGE